MEENKDELYEKAKNAFMNSYPNFEDNIYFLKTYDELKIFYNFLQKYSNNEQILRRTELLDFCEFQELISKLSSDANIDVSALFKQYNTEDQHSEYFLQLILNMHGKQKKNQVISGYNDVLNNPEISEDVKNFITKINLSAKIISSLYTKFSYCDVSYDKFLNDYEHILSRELFADLFADFDVYYKNRGYAPNYLAWLRAQPDQYKKDIFNDFKDSINDISEIQEFVDAIAYNLSNKTAKNEEVVKQVANANNVKDLEGCALGINDLVNNYFKQRILNFNNKKDLNIIKAQLNYLIEQNKFSTNEYVYVNDSFYVWNADTHERRLTELCEKCIDEIDNHPKNQSLITKLKNKFNKDIGRV